MKINSQEVRGLGEMTSKPGKRKAWDLIRHTKQTLCTILDLSKSHDVIDKNNCKLQS